MIPQDFKERLAAVLPGDKNIIVEAGAGTGKTTLLAARLCYLILGKGLKIDQIVALTFTDKAAAEIKLRLMDMLRGVCADLALKEPKLEITKNLTEGKYFKKTKEELIRIIEESFELIERAQICTIHSFALQLLKLYPLQAGLAPQVEIDTGFISASIFDKNWSSFLEEELVLSNPRRALWEQLLNSFSLEQLKNFALLLSKPELEYCKFTNSPGEVKEFFEEKLAQAKALFELKSPLSKHILEVNFKEALNRLETLLKNLSVLSKEELLKLPVQEELKPGGKLKNWTKEETQQANDFISLVNTLTPGNLDLFEKVFGLFSSFVQKVKAEIRKHNIISYAQSILLARDLVQKDLTVRKELKKRYKSLMIDEFQDTDVAQGQLLLFLAEEENSFAKHWQDIVLEQGKLFIVGDPKQSIYRFRGANISAYQKFLELMQKQKARTCFLTVNFRSQGKIIDFVNHWGARAIKEYPLIQPPYIPLQIGREISLEKPEFLQIISDEKISVENLRANEASIVAAWIKENVGKKELTEGRLLSYKDITILYSAGTAINSYTEALKRFDIPYNLEASGNFYQAQEILDILNILKVIYDPQDKLALIGVLRSPLCAMKDEELIDLWQQKALNIFAKNFNGSEAIKNLYKLLRTLHAKAGHITLKDLIGEIFYNTDFLILETLADQSEQAFANLSKFEKFVLDNAFKGLTLGQLLLYIQTYGKQDKDESQTSLTEETFDVVNLMTIHKAKGLQAPVVILIDTYHKQQNISEDYYIDTLTGKIGLKLGSLKNLNYFLLREKEALHTQAQNERFLYVALTRAKQKLLIGISNQETQGVIERSLRKAGCWPAPDNSEEDLFITSCFAYKDPQSFLMKKPQKIITKSNFDWSSALPAWQKRKEEFLTYQKQILVAPSHLNGTEKSGQKALDIGSAVHKTLNLYFQTGSFDLSLALKLLNLEDKTLLLPCQTIINNFAQGSVLKELKTLRFLDSEIPFTICENGILINGIIDALFEDSKGQLFIVDFKTDKINKEELKSSSLKYEQQLALYKRAVQKMFKKQEVRAYLAYLHLDRLFEI